MIVEKMTAMIGTCQVLLTTDLVILTAMTYPKIGTRGVIAEKMETRLPANIAQTTANLSSVLILQLTTINSNKSAKPERIENWLIMVDCRITPMISIGIKIKDRIYCAGMRGSILIDLKSVITITSFSLVKSTMG